MKKLNKEEFILEENTSHPHDSIPEEYRKYIPEFETTEGVKVVGFSFVNPKDIMFDEEKEQSRTTTIVLSHLREIKNSLESWGWDGPPIGTKIDPLTQVRTLKCGHHRTEASKQLGLKEIPTFDLEFFPRKDGLCPEEQFRQARNAHKPALAHNEDDMLKYLNKLKNQTIVKDVLKTSKAPDQKRKELRTALDPILKKLYPAKSSQTRAGTITRFTNGIVTNMIKKWTVASVDTFFTSNNHLENLGVYNLAKNRLDLTTQAHTIDTYPVGQILKELSKNFMNLKQDGVSESKLQNKLKDLQIRVGVYDNEKRTVEELLESREEVLEKAKLINLDNNLYKFKYAEIYFIHQVLQGPHKEPHSPIVYFWNEKTCEYERMEHV